MSRSEVAIQRWRWLEFFQQCTFAHRPALLAAVWLVQDRADQLRCARLRAEPFQSFPRVAIDEAIVNAIYHRSYEEREPVEVRISPEDLVVLSFPGPNRSVRMEDLRAGRAVSRRYRDRRIGEFLKELDLTEGRSTGIPKILGVMRSKGSPPPEFESDEDRTYFLIRLPVHEGTERGVP
jgi:ATP-dependent DNA helicase RecG